MEQLSISYLVAILIFLIICSGFFSSSETGMMSINRYRLRHLARKKNKKAQRVEKLLKRPDRLLGVILVGNTFANLLASAIFTRIDDQLGGMGVFLSTSVLTIIVLIFAEIMPKTVAAIYPVHLSFFVSLPLKILQKILYPLVWTATMVSNGMLRIVGIKVSRHVVESLSRDELRTVVSESGGRIPEEHLEMLVSILDLEQATVEHIMIPRNEVIGIDLTEPWEKILEELKTSQHTRLPVYKENINNVLGMLHMRLALNMLAKGHLSKETLLDATTKPYFIPEGSSLYSQLLNFRHEKERVGLVVDEYGDVIGLATMEDILEEIVGEFTTDILSASKQILPQKDGSYLLDGTLSLRDLNRNLNLDLPVDGPHTLSGLIIEYLETIPNPRTCVLIADYPIEIVTMKGNMVKTARLSPRLSQKKD